MKDNHPEGFWDPRYYTLDRLGEAGLANVRLSLKEFFRMYEAEYPLDCFRLVRDIRAAGRIHLEVAEEGRLSSAFSAAAIYLPEVDSYLIVTKPAPADWKEHSSRRRCNFSLAHELGHIFCGHLTVPRGLKTPEQRRQEDLEADEFAACLLMPERLFLRSRFTSLGELARLFWVSEQACYKRLNNLRRLDRITEPPRPVCPVCGNDRIFPAADYCDICGTRLEELPSSGAQAAEYPRGLTDESGRVLFCPDCGNEEYSAGARFCRICGLPAFNVCADPFGMCRHVNSAGARFCELCGSETEFSRHGVFPPRQEERREYIRALTRGDGA